MIFRLECIGQETNVDNRGQVLCLSFSSFLKLGMLVEISPSQGGGIMLSALGNQIVGIVFLLHPSLLVL